MKPTGKPVVFLFSVVSLFTVLAAGCADTTEQKIKQNTDAAITDTADAMNTAAREVKDFSTNAWSKTKQGAHKVVEVTTNAVNDVKQEFK
jgi:hypothetical protein